MLQKYFLLSISLLLVFLNSDNTKSCGPYFDVYDDYYKIFEDELYNPANLRPFLLSDYIFYNVDETGSVGPSLDNLKEWLKYFENKPVIDDLEKFIYKTSSEELISFLSDPKNLKKEWKENSVFDYADKIKLKDAIDYLIFAKECEPQVALKNTWDEIVRDTIAMNKLLDACIVKINKSKIPFFRERYIYQAIRLAHYSWQYQKTISLFEKYRKDFKHGSLMYYWSMADYAGAVRSLGNSAKANVLFANVFDNCPSRSRESVLSFRYWNDSLFTQTLKSCQNNHDKVLVYTIAAYKNNLFYPDAIKNIYNYEPKSPYLTLILSRQISQLERETLPQKSPWEGYKTYLKPEYNSWYVVSDSTLYQTVFKIADEKKTGNDYLWNYAAGYIAALQHHTGESEKYFYEAKRICPKNNMDEIKRIQIAELVCKVNSLTKITDSTETFLNEKLRWLKDDSSLKKLHSEDALLYIMNTLAKKYWLQKDTIKTHLCLGISGAQRPWEKFFTLPNPYYAPNPFNYDISGDYYNEPVHKLYELISDYQWPSTLNETSGWMRFLLDNFHYSVENLEDILVKEYISRGLFGEVVSKLEPRLHRQGGGNDKSQILPADPFLIHLNDCHDCDFRQKTDTPYTLLSFSQKMIQLNELAEKEKEPEKLAQYYFLLANGYYNITYYGNSWMASCFNYREELSPYYKKGDYFLFYDCSNAKKYYLKAAETSEDNELKAKSYFMAAKCEQNEFYNNVHPEIYEWDGNKYDSKKGKIKNDEYRTYFRKLIEDYSDTEFYKEAIKECKFFNNFVSVYNKN